MEGGVPDTEGFQQTSERWKVNGGLLWTDKNQWWDHSPKYTLKSWREQDSMYKVEPGQILGSEPVGVQKAKVRCGVNTTCVFVWDKFECLYPVPPQSPYAE